MKHYIIFMSAPINLRKTYPQNYRKGEKWVNIVGTRADMLAKVAELQSNGERILRILTALGTTVSI